MITRYAIVLSYVDRSGVVQVVGPYDTEAEALAARPALEAVPVLGMAGCLWEVVPCTDFGAATPPSAAVD